MLKNFIREKYFCGLDIGSQSIKASIVKPREDYKSVLLGVYEAKTYGFKQASISDLGDLSECIHSTIAELTKKTGIKLKEVQLGVGAELIETRRSTAVVPLIDRGSKVITQRDVRKIQNQARLLGAKMEEVILHEFPQCYKVDDVNTALNPVGLYGRKLEVSTLLVITKSNFLKNLTKAVNQAGYDVGNLFFTSFSAAESSLDDYQRKQGCIFVDVGAVMTSILFFKEGQLKHLVSIPSGGEHITRSIAKHLNLTFDLAEDIKRSYAFAINTDDKSEEEILIKREEKYVPIKKEMINEAIEPVIDELVHSISDAIKGSDIYDQMNVGIVMVGGGSLLAGLPERIEQNTNLLVKIGKVNIAIKKLHNAAKYSSAVGLAQTALSKSFRRGPDKNGRVGYSSWTSGVASKIKELYQDYF